MIAKPLAPLPPRVGAAIAWAPRSRSASSATSAVAIAGTGSRTTRSTSGSRSGSRSRVWSRRLRLRVGTQLNVTCGKRFVRRCSIGRSPPRPPSTWTCSGRDACSSSEAISTAGSSSGRSMPLVTISATCTASPAGASARRVIVSVCTLRRASPMSGPGSGLCGRSRRWLGGGDVRGRELAPQRVDVVLRTAFGDCADDGLELVADAGADRLERAVVDVDQPVEAHVRAVARARSRRPCRSSGPAGSSAAAR